MGKISTIFSPKFLQEGDLYNIHKFGRNPGKLRMGGIEMLVNHFCLQFMINLLTFIYTHDAGLNPRTSPIVHNLT